MNGVAVNGINAFVMTMQPGDDADERRLARSVIAENAGHLALANGYADILQGTEIAIALADIAELNDGC